MIQVIYRIKGSNGRSNEIVKRNITGFNPEEYRKEVGKINWEDMYKLDDVELANSFLEENLLKISQ